MTGLPRARGAELMDEPDADARELEHALADLRGVNRWLGGTRQVLDHLRRLRPLLPRGARILDVGTGSADIPLAIARDARRRGAPVRVVATDLHAGTLERARERAAADPDVVVQRADALALPFEDGEFDLALCCTALHHFDDEHAVRVLREMGRVAGGRVLVTDLRRSRPALLGARLLAATVWRRHRFTRHDGPLSVRRAFTPAELRRLAEAAGLRGVRVRREPVFRLSLIAGVDAP